MFEGLVFRLADGIERSSVLQLRRQVYTQELGYDPIDEYDERAPQFVAVRSDGEIVGAFRIVMPWQRPLEIERYVDLSAVIAPGRSVGQSGALWVRPDYRRVTKDAVLPLGLLKLAFAFARKSGITDLVMRTPTPALRVFYRRAYFLEIERLNFDHPVCGRVYVMHADLLSLEAHWSQLEDPIARFLFLADLPNVKV